MTLMLFKLVDSPVMLMMCQNTSFYTRFSSASINTKDLPNALVSSSPLATSTKSSSQMPLRCELTGVQRPPCSCNLWPQGADTPQSYLHFIVFINASKMPFPDSSSQYGGVMSITHVERRTRCLLVFYDNSLANCHLASVRLQWRPGTQYNRYQWRV